MKSPYCFLLFLLLPVVAMATTDRPTDTVPNNLVHPAGYETAEWGALPYQKSGTGDQALILLAGWGFDASVFREFIDSNRQRYTMYALTLPGYGATQAYPMPAAEASYSEGAWFKGVMTGLLNLIKTEQLQRPVLLAHFAVSTHLALQLAATHPEQFEKVVIVGGPVHFRNPPPYDTLDYRGRVRITDAYLAPRWFKTVTMETWRNGNFPPSFYALDTLLGKQLFEEANRAPLPVQIRYLCENWAADYAVYEQVRLPVLVVMPSFTPAMLANPATAYAKWHRDDWAELAAKNPYFKTVEVEGTGCNVMNEKPAELSRLLADFLKE